MELVKKEDATDDGLDDFVEPLDRVFNAGKHLLTLINDVLDRTESACPQDLTYLSMELAIKAQEQAEKK